MISTPSTPSPVRILRHDWPTLAAATAIPILWAIWVPFPLLKRGVAFLPVVLPAVATVALALVFAWRIRRIRWFFAHGARTQGHVFDLILAKDRGRREFLFEVDGRRVRSRMPVHKTKAVLAMQPGRRVGVLYDASAPRRAIVQELFER